MSILLQTEYIEQNNQQSIKDQSQITHNDTEILKEKMKILQMEIQTLQNLKTSKKFSLKNSSLKNQQNSIKNQNTQNENEENCQSDSIMSQNLKNSKINDLISQLSFKDQFPTKRKRSWSRTLAPHSQRQSVRNIKQTLQKIEISEQKKKKKIAAKIFSQKQQNNNVQSNIFNVTIAEIMAGQQKRKQEEKVQMLSQIVDLKSKIKELTTQKEKKEKQSQVIDQTYGSPVQQLTVRIPIRTSQFRPYQQESTFRTQQQDQYLQGERSYRNTLRSSIAETGKIYSKSRVLKPQNEDNYDSQSSNTLDYELHSIPLQSIQLKKNSNRFTWNPEITLTIAQQSNNQLNKKQIRSGRIYSSIQRQGGKKFSVQQRQQKSNKPIFNINRKKGNFSKSKIQDQEAKNNQKTQKKQKQSQQKQSQPQKPVEKFKSPQQRINQIKIQKIINQPSPPKDFLPNFRQHIEEKLLPIKLPSIPTLQFGQSQLQEMGKALFCLFDIFVEEEIQKKGIEYKVTKYKNCVLFRLNEEKNIVWYFDGRFYFGGWEISLIGQAKKEGFGYEIIPKKYIYQGFYRNSKRQGYGIMAQLLQNQQEKKTNIIYEGMWKQGIKNGPGYQIQAQLQYLGDYEMGLQTGKCKIKTDQTLYQGEIKDSVKVGKGHQVLRNGDQYSGNFQNNLFNGTGQYRWNSGAYFYGTFVNGIRNGQGIWISNIYAENFDIYKGSYQNNKKKGYGVYQWANGTIYDGYFKNDLRHDEGIMVFPNGKAAKFIWNEGVKTTKLYCQEEQIYRRQRNSQKKIDTNGQNLQNSENKNQKKQKWVRFREQIINHLKSSNLHLFDFGNSQLKKQPKND